MADTVQEVMERMVPELEEYRELRLFNDDEIRAIVKKRRDFEYLLRRKVPRKADFLRCVSYELKLDELRALRKRKRGIFKRCQTDFACVLRIHFIFARLLRKFDEDKQLWSQYIEYCMRIKANKHLGKLFPRVLRLHPRHADFWIRAAAWEFDNTLNMSAARVLLQRGLRVNPSSKKLWVAFFKMELLYVQRMKARREVLGLAGPSAPPVLDAEADGPAGASAGGGGSTSVDWEEGDSSGSDHASEGERGSGSESGSRSRSESGSGSDVDDEGGSGSDRESGSDGDSDSDAEVTAGTVKTGAPKAPRPQPTVSVEELETAAEPLDPSAVITDTALLGPPETLAGLTPRDRFLLGAIPCVVFNNAVKTVPGDLDFQIELLETCDSVFDLTVNHKAVLLPRLSAAITQAIASQFAEDPRMWEFLISRAATSGAKPHVVQQQVAALMESLIAVCASTGGSSVVSLDTIALQLSALARLGRSSEAVELATAATASHPSSSRAWLMLVDAMYAQAAARAESPSLPPAQKADGTTGGGKGRGKSAGTKRPRAGDEAPTNPTATSQLDWDGAAKSCLRKSVTKHVIAVLDRGIASVPYRSADMEELWRAKMTVMVGSHFGAKAAAGHRESRETIESHFQTAAAHGVLHDEYMSWATLAGDSKLVQRCRTQLRR